MKTRRLGGIDLDVIGKGVIRKDAWDKVTGDAKYTDDYQSVGMLSCTKVISPYGHARITYD